MNSIIQSVKQKGRSLYEYESLALLAEYGITVQRHAFAADKREALQKADDIGYPLVLKIVSGDILHKSDAGGVVTGIKSPDQLEYHYDMMMKKIAAHQPDAKIKGVLLLEYAEQGIECIAGMIRDENFGPALMFGLGGVWVELFDDVSLELLPVNRDDALRMIGATKAGKLLNGYRGGKRGDVSGMADLLVKLGRLAAENPEIKEIDLNPVFVYESGVLPVDARILV